MALTVISGEIRAQPLNDNFSEGKANLDTHKAETITQRIEFSRDTSLTGSQIISGFNFNPEVILIDGVISLTQKQSRGAGVNGGGVYHVATNQANGDWLRSATRLVAFYESATSVTWATVTFNTDKTITLDWTIAGAGSTGTADVFITAIAHKKDVV